MELGSGVATSDSKNIAKDSAASIIDMYASETEESKTVDEDSGTMRRLVRGGDLGVVWPGGEGPRNATSLR